MATRVLALDDIAGGVTATSPTKPFLAAPVWGAVRGDSVLYTDWSELAAHSSQPNPFFTPWALPSALDAFANARSAKLVQCRSIGRLDGVLPLAREAFYYDRPIPHLRNWMHANAFCGAPLVRAGQERVFWQALFEWCDDNAGAALFLHLTHLPSDSALFAALRRTVALENRAAAIVQREERALLQSGLSPDDYLAQSLSTKKRKELRRQHRRLGEEGNLAFVRQRGSEGVNDWTEQFLALERAGWKGREGSALACCPKTARIFRDTLAGAAQAGALERLSYALDGRPIAMLANFRTPPGAFSYKTTYDEDYARFSPGVLLQRENLDNLNDPDIAWTDSCAAADHPMIDSIWRERREMVRVSIAIGGGARRLLARTIIAAEAGASGMGL